MQNIFCVTSCELAVYVQTNTMVFSNTDTDTDVGIANTDQQIPKVLNCFSDLSYLIFTIIINYCYFSEEVIVYNYL